MQRVSRFLIKATERTLQFGTHCLGMASGREQLARFYFDAGTDAESIQEIIEAQRRAVMTWAVTIGLVLLVVGRDRFEGRFVHGSRARHRSTLTVLPARSGR
jgi:hypothetical protein